MFLKFKRAAWALLILPHFVHAKELVLFRSGHPVPEYNRWVDRIQEGDQLVFSGEAAFTVKQILGKGSDHAMSFIFENEDGKVVRIARRRLSFNNQTELEPMEQAPWERSVLSFTGPSGLFQAHARDPFVDYLAGYASGYKQLAMAGVPIVKVHADLSHPLEYVVTDKVNVLTTLAKLNRHLADYKDSELEKMKREFIAFVQKTILFAEIGDFGPDQLVWTGETWLLLDFTAKHSVWNVSRKRTQSCLDQLPKFNTQIDDWVREASERLTESRRYVRPGQCEALMDFASGNNLPPPSY